MSYRKGQKVRLLDTNKVITITAVNEHGVPTQGVSQDGIIDLVGRVFILIGLIEKLAILIKSLFRK